jgi:Flp pilus assembly protein TadD
VLKRFPGSADAHTYLGRALLEGGRMAEAVAHLERAVALAPESAQAHLLLAKAYVRSGRGAEAEGHFEQAARYGAEREE